MFCVDFIEDTSVVICKLLVIVQFSSIHQVFCNSSLFMDGRSISFKMQNETKYICCYSIDQLVFDLRLRFLRCRPCSGLCVKITTLIFNTSLAYVLLTKLGFLFSLSSIFLLSRSFLPTLINLFLYHY